ncbi:MAG: YHYH protein [Planctomycetota bacterium]
MVIGEAALAFYSDRWKLIRSGENIELFDIFKDPYENEDVSTSEAPIADKLDGELSEFLSLVEADQPFSSEVARNPKFVAKASDTFSEGAALEKAKLTGDVQYSVLGNRLTESNGMGIRLMSAIDDNNDGASKGEASIVKQGIESDSRWYRFDILALAQDDFAVGRDDLYLKVEFLRSTNEGSLDFIKTRIYPQVERERKDLRDERTNESLGNATWRTYAMDFRTPFAEIDSVKLSVGFADGKGGEGKSEFWVSSMNLRAIAAPADYAPPANSSRHFPQPNESTLVALGGRWFYDPQGGPSQVPKQFDYTNADQLLYKSDRFEAPFAGNMSSWLRAGYKDFDGNIVKEDKYKPYAVIITNTKDHIVMRSRNLPNHPTATFPDMWRMLDGNPSYIQEKANIWYLPKYPKLAQDPLAMDEKNSNGALPMGPIGVAINGVALFNQYAAGFSPLDNEIRSFDLHNGHPANRGNYHYHIVFWLTMLQIVLFLLARTI